MPINFHPPPVTCPPSPPLEIYPRPPAASLFQSPPASISATFPADPAPPVLPRCATRHNRQILTKHQKSQTTEVSNLYKDLSYLSGCARLECLSHEDQFTARDNGSLHGRVRKMNRDELLR
ncbi:hypothetical protein BaRGS_00028591 [Batillaria attramentaria]|uniref:Uncharacterized protein n=1 Tax=Batillaria attramentaria TaxID=370345 RepID=A0ABD0JZL1_9CAEN